MAKLTTDEIYKAISKVVSNTHDGATTPEGEPIKIGLSREEDDDAFSHGFRERLMDGFAVVFYGTTMAIKYHTQCNLDVLKKNNFETGIKKKVNNIKKYIQKEYKKETGQAVGLKEVKAEFVVNVEYISRKRCWATTKVEYTIGGVDSYPDDDQHKKDADDAIKKFLALHSKQNPKNRTYKGKQ
jgi:hypothetical protein